MVTSCYRWLWVVTGDSAFKVKPNFTNRQTYNLLALYIDHYHHHHHIKPAQLLSTLCQTCLAGFCQWPVPVDAPNTSSHECSQIGNTKLYLPSKTTLLVKKCLAALHAAANSSFKLINISHELLAKWWSEICLLWNCLQMGGGKIELSWPQWLNLKWWEDSRGLILDETNFMEPITISLRIRA